MHISVREKNVLIFIQKTYEKKIGTNFERLVYMTCRVKIEICVSFGSSLHTSMICEQNGRCRVKKLKNCNMVFMFKIIFFDTLFVNLCISFSLFIILCMLRTFYFLSDSIKIILTAAIFYF